MMKTQKIKVIEDNPGEWLFNQKINFELGVTSVENYLKMKYLKLLFLEGQMWVNLAC